MVRIQGLIGMVSALRPNVRWPFAQLLIRDNGRKAVLVRRRRSVNGRCRETGVPLIEEFCSKPLPK